MRWLKIGGVVVVLAVLVYAAMKFWKNDSTALGTSVVGATNITASMPSVCGDTTQTPSSGITNASNQTGTRSTLQVTSSNPMPIGLVSTGTPSSGDPLPIPIVKTPTIDPDIVSVGCFGDRSDAPAMITSVGGRATYTVCKERAVAGGYKYFALQDGRIDNTAVCMVSNDRASVIKYQRRASFGSMFDNNERPLGAPNVNAVYERINFVPTESAPAVTSNTSLTPLPTVPVHYDDKGRMFWLP